MLVANNSIDTYSSNESSEEDVPPPPEKPVKRVLFELFIFSICNRKGMKIKVKKK